MNQSRSRCLGTPQPPLLLCALLAAALSSTTSRLAAEPSVFNGQLTADERSELRAWGTQFIARLDTGKAKPVKFSNAAMNSPLFNPLAGPRATLERLSLIDDTDCWQWIVSCRDCPEPVIAAKRSAIRTVLSGGQLQTNINANSAGTLEHITKIIDATTRDDADDINVWIENGVLFSMNLPMDPAINARADEHRVSTLEKSTLNTLAALADKCPALCNDAAAAPHQRVALLTGEPTQRDLVAAGIAALLADAGFTAAPITHLDIVFGVYGSLPALQVDLPAATVLIDTTNGRIAGPYIPGSSIPAAALLAAHSDVFQPGTPVKTYNALGCAAPVLAQWAPGLPPPATPTGPAFTPKPANPLPRFPTGPATWPGVPAPSPTYNPTLPGWWTTWDCVPTNLPSPGTCTCTSYALYQDGNGNVRTVRRVCSSNAGQCAVLAPNPAGTVPTSPFPPTLPAPFACNPLDYWK